MSTQQAIEFLARHLSVDSSLIVNKATYFSVESPRGYRIKRLWSGLFESEGKFFSCALERPASFSEVDQDIAQFRISQSESIRENFGSGLSCPVDDLWVSSVYVNKKDQELINVNTPMQCIMSGSGRYTHPTDGLKEYNKGDLIVINMHQQDKTFDVNDIAYTKTP